jgi:hypothetical protein
LAQEKGLDLPSHDPRLSPAGNRIFEQLGTLLRQLTRIEVWLAHQGRTGITAEDRRILQPRFERLSRDAASVAALSADMAMECDNDGRIHPQRDRSDVLPPGITSPHCEDARCGP